MTEERKGCLSIFVFIFLALVGYKGCGGPVQNIITKSAPMLSIAVSITEMLSNLLAYFEKTEVENVYKITTNQAVEYFNPVAFASDGNIDNVDDLQRYDNYIDETARACRKQLLREHKDIKNEVAMHRFMGQCLRNSGLPTNSISYYNAKKYLNSINAPL